MSFLALSIEASESRIEYKTLKGVVERLWQIDQSAEFSIFAGFSLDLCRKIKKNDVIILGGPIFLQTILILFIFLCRKKIVFLVWDTYPVCINGVPFGNPLKIKIQIWGEWLVKNLVDLFVLPSADFMEAFSDTKSVVIPFWPLKVVDNVIEKTGSENKFSNESRAIRVLFCGQNNFTRDLNSCYSMLKDCFDFEFDLLIASDTAPDSEILENPDVSFLGYLSTSELAAVAADADIGLITLNEGLDNPAFPSKIFDYVRYGLPIVYFGPKLDAYENIILNHLGGYVLKRGELVTVNDLIRNFRKRNKNTFLDTVCFTTSNALELKQII